jgi:hypothetical protein
MDRAISRKEEMRAKMQAKRRGKMLGTNTSQYNTLSPSQTPRNLNSLSKDLSRYT